MGRLTVALDGKFVKITKTTGGNVERAISVVGLTLTQRPGGFKINEYFLKLIDTDYANIGAMRTALLDLLDGLVLTVAQPDWNQASNVADDYIKNKPTLGNMAAETKTDYCKKSDGADGTFVDNDANVVTVVKGQITDLDT